MTAEFEGEAPSGGHTQGWDAFGACLPVRAEGGAAEGRQARAALARVRLALLHDGLQARIIGIVLEAVASQQRHVEPRAHEPGREGAAQLVVRQSDFPKPLEKGGTARLGRTVPLAGAGQLPAQRVVTQLKPLQVRDGAVPEGIERQRAVQPVAVHLERYHDAVRRAEGGTAARRTASGAAISPVVVTLVPVNAPRVTCPSRAPACAAVVEQEWQVLRTAAHARPLIDARLADTPVGVVCPGGAVSRSEESHEGCRQTGRRRRGRRR